MYLSTFIKSNLKSNLSVSPGMILKLITHTKLLIEISGV